MADFTPPFALKGKPIPVDHFKAILHISNRVQLLAERQRKINNEFIEKQRVVTTELEDLRECLITNLSFLLEKKNDHSDTGSLDRHSEEVVGQADSQDKSTISRLADLQTINDTRTHFKKSSFHNTNFRQIHNNSSRGKLYSTGHTSSYPPKREYN